MDIPQFVHSLQKDISLKSFLVVRRRDGKRERAGVKTGGWGETSWTTISGNGDSGPETRMGGDSRDFHEGEQAGHGWLIG